MAKASWNEVVIAESDVYEKVEGNIYFPSDSINKEYFKESDTHSTCFWKGKASYYDVEVTGKPTRMLLGIILIQNQKQKILKIMWRSGKG